MKPPRLADRRLTPAKPTSPAAEAPAGTRRGWRPALRGAILGAGAGASWGVAARFWMRLVATDPSFTWSGTLLILGVATLAGTLLGLAIAGRDGRFPRVSRTVGAVSILPIGVGAGVVLLPAVIAATFAAPGRIPRLPGRLLAASLPCVAILVVGLDGSTLRWVAVGLVALVALGVGAGTFRPLMALYAAAAVGLVIVPMFDGTRSITRAAVVSVFYLALLLPPTLAFHRAVRRGDTRADRPDATHRPDAPGHPDPPATAGGTEPTEVPT